MEAKVASSNHLGVGFERENEKRKLSDADQSKPGGDHKPGGTPSSLQKKRRALN